MMNTLYLAWQHAGTRRWFPVGRLTGGERGYRFVYIGGVQAARNEGEFVPLPDFPDFDAVYESDRLFPLFANRVMPTSRPDFAEVVTWLHLKGREKDPLAFLAESNGRRQTDSFEVFPAAEVTCDGGRRTTFFVHGLRHVSPAARERMEMLKPGERLLLQWDAQNPVDPCAIGLRTHARQSGDATMLGYCPRYLANSILASLRKDRTGVEAWALSVHPENPPQYAVRCELRFRPAAVFPFEGPEFQPLAG